MQKRPEKFVKKATLEMILKKKNIYIYDIIIYIKTVDD